MHKSPAQPPPNGDAVDLTRVDAATRARVSGPGLRAFKAIAEEWGVSEAERRRLLGEPPRSTYHAWIRKAEAHQKLTLPLDTLLRISAVLGVHKALRILFPRESEALAWLKSPHAGILFGGQPPMALMLSGTQDGILQVRRYLDAWRGGLHGAPAADSGVAAITRDDLVFI